MTSSTARPCIRGWSLTSSTARPCIRNDLGLSEKLLIVQKKESGRKLHFSLKDLFNIDTISDKLRTMEQIINQNNLAHQDLFRKIIELVNHLEEGEELHNDSVN